MSAVEVRAAGMGDVEAMVLLERATASAPHWSAEVYGEMMRGDGAVRRGVFVTERAGDLVGFVVGSLVGCEGEIESVAVKQSERRQGVGRALVEAVMAWCGDAGAKEIGLEVREGGVAARALYEAAGFQVVGRRVGYYDDPVEDALAMVRRLDGSGGTVERW